MKEYIIAIIGLGYVVSVISWVGNWRYWAFIHGAMFGHGIVMAVLYLRD